MRPDLERPGAPGRDCRQAGAFLRSENLRRHARAPGSRAQAAASRAGLTDDSPLRPGFSPGRISDSCLRESSSIAARSSRSTSAPATAAALPPALQVANRIAVNGCCLPTPPLGNATFSADLSGETLEKTSFGRGPAAPRNGARVNLEQPLKAGKELGGHLVLGHVDATG